MKHFIYLFLLSSFLFIGVTAHSQSNYPTAIGTKWEYVSLNYFDFGTFIGPFAAFTDEIVADSSINGVVYHKVIRTSTGPEGHWFFRTDSTNKVWVLDSLVSNQAYESQWFDYAVATGDTLSGSLRSIQDLANQTMPIDYSNGEAVIIESDFSSNGPVMVPATQNGHYMQFMPGIGQVAYEFRCLADFCPDPNFYLERLSQGSQILYERNFTTVSVEDQLGDLASLDAYPNPCTDKLRVNYQLTETADIALELYNAEGKKMHSFLRETQGPGSYEFFLYPKETPLKPGIYLIRLSAGQKSTVKKILYLK